MRWKQWLVLAILAAYTVFSAGPFVWVATMSVRTTTEISRAHYAWPSQWHWHKFADASRLRLRDQTSLAPEHPVWASRPYKVFLRTPHEVRTRVRYVELNPEKEGLPRQHYEFVTAYNSWPFHKR